jgi:hypothetical protein
MAVGTKETGTRDHPSLLCALSNTHPIKNKPESLEANDNPAGISSFSKSRQDQLLRGCGRTGIWFEPQLSLMYVSSSSGC